MIFIIFFDLLFHKLYMFHNLKIKRPDKLSLKLVAIFYLILKIYLFIKIQKFLYVLLLILNVTFFKFKTFDHNSNYRVLIFSVYGTIIFTCPEIRILKIISSKRSPGFWPEYSFFFYIMHRNRNP